MKAYTVKDNTVSFRQSKFPAQWMPAFSQLDIQVHLTGSKLYPFSVQLSESEFLSALEMAKTLI